MTKNRLILLKRLSGYFAEGLTSIQNRYLNGYRKYFKFSWKINTTDRKIFFLNAQSWFKLNMLQHLGLFVRQSTVICFTF